MDLFLIRHAKAADGALYGDDAARPLTADGRGAALSVGAALARQGVKLDAIACSPLVRAVETAELVAVSLAYEGQLAIHHELQPEAGPRQMIDRVLRPLASHARVALVGHQPSMGHLLSTLLGKHGNAHMSKAGVARITWSDGKPAQLVWVMTPKKLDPVASLDAL